MAVEFYQLGEVLPDQQPEYLTMVSARRTLAACLCSNTFEVIELRRWNQPGAGDADVIVVDCINDQVPSRNIVGVKVRERLALVFPSNLERAPEVRTLRTNFPSVPHLNLVTSGEPSSLCLYFDPWSAVERTWTPKKHLQRILWWLAKTATNSLHRPDQPVERIYFDPFLELILPPDFDEKVRDPALALTLCLVHQTATKQILRGTFEPKARGFPEIIPIVLALEMVHGEVEPYPATLGELHDQFLRRGAAFFESLCDFIRRNAPPGGATTNQRQACLLLLHIGIKRAQNEAPERVETKGFLVEKDFATLGKAAGVLTAHDGKYYYTASIGGVPQRDSTEWRSFECKIVDVKKTLTKTLARRASGVEESTAEFKGVLAGLGALGSTIADLWAREMWGSWTLVDGDFVQPHNVVRHIAKDLHIGSPKVDIVKNMVEHNFDRGYHVVHAVHDSATNWTNPLVRNAIVAASVLVDVTTTLEVPREISQHEETPRSASVFLTPSGLGSVLLLEDAARAVRLEALEAQYYRAIINADWGAQHLAESKGNVWVGRGCRDVSVVMSYEMVMVHAGTLARQVRHLYAHADPRIRIWTLEDDTGQLSVHEVSVRQSAYVICAEWRVVWDAGIQDRLSEIRNTALPRETGGVVLGYIDHKVRTIFVVDVLSAPSDSEASETGFTRGVDGLAVVLNEVNRRTKGIVGYVGEWHSHPPFASARPSADDRVLVQRLANVLALDGDPALMIIVGAGDYCISVRDVSSTHAESKRDERTPEDRPLT